MYTVLIADDETIVRMMLSSMIDWEEMEAQTGRLRFQTAVKLSPTWSSILWIS